MAARGREQSAYGGRVVQAPGMLRHGPVPGLGVAGPHHLEPLPPEFLENKVATQAAEMERLIRENQKLAASQATMREELLVVQKEIQRIEAHMGSIETESDLQVRSLLEKVAKLEANLCAGGTLKKDLQKAHLEAQSLVAARQELIAQIKQTTMELQKADLDTRNLPEMQAELDSLREEHQKLCAAFEYEKGLNIKQVDQMCAMENNLISMAREVEKLRAEALNAEKRTSAPNSYRGIGHGMPDPPYSTVGQSRGFIDAFGRPQVHMSSETTSEGMNAYEGKSTSGNAVTSGIKNGPYDAVRGTSLVWR